MFNELYVNDVLLPLPDDDISFTPEKVKSEKQSEAGTTIAIITRILKISISASWTLTAAWADKFRAWRDADTVTVKCFYPDTAMLSEHTCQFEISGEKHIRKSRAQLGNNSLYKMDVQITEL